MATTLEQILSYLANSKSVDQLPTASALPTTGYIPFYNPLTSQLEKISAAQFGGIGAWKWIADSWVDKGSGNTDLDALEIGDEVYFKKINNGGDRLTLVGFTYDGPDPDLESSYTQNQVITN